MQVTGVEVKAAQKIGIEELYERVLGAIQSAVAKNDLQFSESSLENNSTNSFIHLDPQNDSKANRRIFARYKFISNVYQETVNTKESEEQSLSEKIDRVLIHKFFGLVILIAILLLVFQNDNVGLFRIVSDISGRKALKLRKLKTFILVFVNKIT